MNKGRILKKLFLYTFFGGKERVPPRAQRSRLEALTQTPLRFASACGGVSALMHLSSAVACYGGWTRLGCETMGFKTNT